MGPGWKTVLVTWRQNANLDFSPNSFRSRRFRDQKLVDLSNGFAILELFKLDLSCIPFPAFKVFKDLELLKS